VAASGPTVGRRRLAAELRGLRGTRTGGVVASALGWSAAKISRYELGQTSFPPDEIEKLLDFYGVTEPRRGQLLALAADANARGWWEDYADVLSQGYMELIGLEAEAASMAEWQTAAIPGLLQTEEYARQVHAAFQNVVLTPPGQVERRTRVRRNRQRVLTERNPPLELSAVMDESVLLRKVGSREVMFDQMRHLVEMSELPNIDLRVVPLQSDSSLMADSFVVLGFGQQHEASKLGDVVATEGQNGQVLSIEGETDTYVYRLIFKAFHEASLSPEETHDLILETARRVWSENESDLV
jgi:transcriptional regulator with XRE-family HTH domain